MTSTSRTNRIAQLLTLMALLLYGLLSTPAYPQLWTPEMCTKQQPYASDEYIAYCINATKNFPACSLDGHDPRESMWAAQASGGKGAYFEVLDCSWHPGKNPRYSIPPQTRITPAEVCKRNGAGWVYTAGVCYGPGTQVPLAQSCRVMRGPIEHPVTPWIPCGKARGIVRGYIKKAQYAWIERREGK